MESETKADRPVGLERELCAAHPSLSRPSLLGYDCLAIAGKMLTR